MEFNLNPHVFLWIYQVGISLDGNGHIFFFKDKQLWSLVLLPHSWQVRRALAFLGGGHFAL